MSTVKKIILEGGPLDGKELTVDKPSMYIEYEADNPPPRKYYRKTNRMKDNMEIFVWIKFNEKDEPNNESTQAG